MKEILKYYKKPLIISLSAVIFQLIIYKISALLGNNPVILISEVDKNLPFIVEFIIPYISWYILLFLIPLIIYKKDKKDFIRYITTYIILSLVADIIYIIYPTAVIRPVIINDINIFSKLAKIIFTIDTPIRNCFPSLHTAISLLWILFILEKGKYNINVKILTLLISIIIIISTLLIKQHVILDALSAIILTIIIYYITKINNNLTNKIYTKVSRTLEY